MTTVRTSASQDRRILELRMVTGRDPAGGDGVQVESKEDHEFAAFYIRALA